MPVSGNIFKGRKANNDDNGDGPVARFRSGYQANGKPVGLSEFRVTAADAEILDSIAEAMGGSIDPAKEWETQSAEKFEVFTEASSVPIILDGKGSVRASLVLWSAKNTIIRETDGEFLIEDGKLTDEPDPDRDKPLSERKEMAREGSGPEPSIRVFFRLAEAPELGIIKFFSGSWTAIEEFGEAEEAMASAAGPMRATLSLEKVEFEADGKTRSFTKPRITIDGPVEEEG